MIDVLQWLPVFAALETMRQDGMELEAEVQAMAEEDNEKIELLTGRLEDLLELRATVDEGKPAHLSSVEWLRAQRSELAKLGG